MKARIITLTKKYSFFLFGARGTGKSWLIKSLFNNGNTFYIDLLDPAVESKYSLNPTLLLNEVLALSSNVQYVVIDEVQKLPDLLSVVHKLIETPCPQHFILTGSSARKLKQAGVDLLAGRAFVYSLYPFSFRELQEEFSLEQALSYGMLPKIYDFEEGADKIRFLQAYTQTYLKEEIWAEHIIKKMPPFRRFLEVAAQANGKIINYHKIAQDIGVDDKTVQNYFTILEDTLVGYVLEPFHNSFRKRLSAKPKFYYFDVGVARCLANLLDITPKAGTSYYGEVFEHFIVLESIKLNQYYERHYRFSYLATPAGVEVDLVIERPGKPLLLVEIKSAGLMTEDKLTQLKSIKKDLIDAEAVVLSQDPIQKRFDDIYALPWDKGLVWIFEEG